MHVELTKLLQVMVCHLHVLSPIYLIINETCLFWLPARLLKSLKCIRLKPNQKRKPKKIAIFYSHIACTGCNYKYIDLCYIYSLLIYKKNLLK